MVAIITYFQFWKKKERNIIIIRRVISSHLGPMYIERHYICEQIQN